MESLRVRKHDNAAPGALSGLESLQLNAEAGMSITIETATNCRLIEPTCLGLDANISARALTLLDILALRRTQRAFSPEPLPLYRLSRVLWAGFGYNRKELGLRTAPSACNGQEIDIYVATIDGLYL